MTYGPLFRTSPSWVRTNGDIAARVGVDLGLALDAEQRWSLDVMFAEDECGLPAAPEFCIVGPRQTSGKSAALEVAAITDVTVFEVPLHVWTAHEFKTSRKAYLDMRQRLLRHPDYASRCTFRDSHGEEAIIFDNECAIEFHARSGGSGRGFTTSRLTLDEWMYGQPGDLGALVPTLVTIEDAQVRYASSAGKPLSAALRELRRRGRAGGDESLAYVEHGAQRRPCESGRCTHEVGIEGCALDDEDLWREANVGLRTGRVSLAAMRRQRLALPPQEFMREFLSWWEDPPHEDGGAFDVKRWKALADPAAERGDAPVFAVATPRDRSWCAAAVAWRRPDGDRQVMLVDDGYQPGTAWVAARVAELRRRWRGRVLVDTTSRGLVPDVEEPSEADQAEAHNALSDAIAAGTVHHGNQLALNTAIRGARWKNRGTTRVLDRDGQVEISPAAAAAMALHGLTANAGPSVYEERGLLTV